MKHKNQIIADDNFKNFNCEYTVFKRSGGKYKMIKNIEEFHQAVFDLIDYKMDKARISLNSDGKKFYVVRYDEDGSYWVVGYIYRGSLC